MELKQEIIHELKRRLVQPEWEAVEYQRSEGADGLREALQVLSCPSFFGSRLLVVTGVGPANLSAEKDRIAEVVHLCQNRGGALPGSIVVDLGSDTGKDNAAMIALSKTVYMVDCGNLRRQELKEWLVRKTGSLGKILDVAAQDAIFDENNLDVGVLAREIEKAAAYCGDRKTITREDLIEVTHLRRFRVFDVLDAIRAADSKRPINILREIIKDGEPPIKILQLIYSHFSMAYEIKLMFKAGHDMTAVKSRFKRYNRFFIENAVRRAKEHEELQLENALLNLAEADLNIKRGRVKPDVALECLLASLVSKT